MPHALAWIVLAAGISYAALMVGIVSERMEREKAVREARRDQMEKAIAAAEKTNLDYANEACERDIFETLRKMRDALP